MSQLLEGLGYERYFFFLFLFVWVRISFQGASHGYILGAQIFALYLPDLSCSMEGKETFWFQLINVFAW